MSLYPFETVIKDMPLHKTCLNMSSATGNLPSPVYAGGHIYSFSSVTQSKSDKKSDVKDGAP